MHFLLLAKEASLIQLGHNMLSLFQHINMGPFPHEPKKKEDFEPEPLYIELYPIPSFPTKKEEEKEERGVVIIELW